jgi:hypothetical protein
MVARSPVLPYVPIGHQSSRAFAPRAGLPADAGENFHQERKGPAVSQVPFTVSLVFTART